MSYLLSIHSRLNLISYVDVTDRPTDDEYMCGHSYISKGSEFSSLLMRPCKSALPLSNELDAKASSLITMISGDANM